MGGQPFSGRPRQPPAVPCFVRCLIGLGEGALLVHQGDSRDGPPLFREHALSAEHAPGRHPRVPGPARLHHHMGRDLPFSLVCGRVPYGRRLGRRGAGGWRSASAGRRAEPWSARCGLGWSEYGRPGVGGGSDPEWAELVEGEDLVGEAIQRLLDQVQLLTLRAVRDPGGRFGRAVNGRCRLCSAATAMCRCCPPRRCSTPRSLCGVYGAWTQRPLGS